MKEIVNKYLDKQYLFTPYTYVSYKLFNKETNTEVRIPTICKDLVKVFGIEGDNADLLEYFNLWLEAKATIMNNRITDFKYAYYQKYGIEIPVGDIEGAFSEDEWVGV